MKEGKNEEEKSGKRKIRRMNSRIEAEGLEKNEDEEGEKREGRVGEK